MLFYEDSTTEDLFYYAMAQSEICRFFCKQFLSKAVESSPCFSLFAVKDAQDCKLSTYLSLNTYAIFRSLSFSKSN